MGYVLMPLDEHLNQLFRKRKKFYTGLFGKLYEHAASKKGLNFIEKLERALEEIRGEMIDSNFYKERGRRARKKHKRKPNLTLTYERYKELRDKGRSHEDIENRYPNMNRRKLAGYIRAYNRHEIKSER